MKEKDRHRSEQAIGRILRRYVRRKRFLRSSTVKGTLANELGLDSFELHQYLMKEEGCDAATWRTGLRIEWAKQLILAEPGTPLRDIATRSGFSDHSNFSKQFLAHTGVPPSLWRRQAKLQ